MKIYSVIGIDKLNDCELTNARTIKAFSDQRKAMDFVSDCFAKFQEWDNQCPDSSDEKEWEVFCQKHPFYDYGHMPTAFLLEEVEFDQQHGH